MELSDSVWEFQMLVIFNLLRAHWIIPDQRHFQQYYSLSGEFNTLTKLIFCLVMIRGRHRGLPAAIDRAVMLPAKLRQTDDLIGENSMIDDGSGSARATSLTPTRSVWLIINRKHVHWCLTSLEGSTSIKAYHRISPISMPWGLVMPYPWGPLSSEYKIWS